MKSISIIIPAFNESKTIVEVVNKIKTISEISEIIVIDDASTDNTYELIKGLNIIALKNPYNKGNGASVKNGILNANSDYCLVIDGDGQHKPEDIKKLISYIDDYDLIIGSRTNESDSSKFRDVGNFIFNSVASYLAEFDIKDLTSGFRLFDRKKSLEFFHLYPNKFSFPSTITMAFLNEAYNVKYVPIIAKKRVEGSSSSIKPFKDGIRFLRILFKITALYNPTKIFYPLAGLFFVFGVFWAFMTYFNGTQTGISGAALSSLGISVLLILFSLVFEVLSLIAKQKDR
jgi:glycosyltransferase involved in cell wall biosynthesis